MSEPPTLNTAPHGGSTAAHGFHPVALLAAIALPGAGHVVRGQTARGVLAGVGVLGMFLGGLLIGGIDVVDRKESRMWFMGQACVGPIAFAVDYIHQTRFKGVPEEAVRARRADVRRSPLPGEYLRTGEMSTIDPQTRKERTVTAPLLVRSPEGAVRANVKALGKMGELGTLYACIAGFMNLIVILDAGFPTTRRPIPRPQKGAPA
jgi:hypothetical protein